MIVDVEVMVSCNPKATEETRNKALEDLAGAIMDLQYAFKGIEVSCLSVSRPYKPDWWDDDEEEDWWWEDEEDNEGEE